jgi:MoxR-like ATPase
MQTIPVGPALLELLVLAYRADQPVLLHGRHGVGKSAVLAAAAAHLGIGLIVRDLSLMEPPDLLGIPRVGEDGRTHYAVPAFLPQTGRGLLVFEELNRCPRYMARNEHSCHSRQSSVFPTL